MTFEEMYRALTEPHPEISDEQARIYLRKARVDMGIRDLREAEALRRILGLDDRRPT